MKIRLTQIDGRLPNLALMKIAHYFKSKNADVIYKKSIYKDVFENNYDFVFGSTIFSTSEKKINIFLNQFPNAILGGSGSNNNITVEKFLNLSEYENYDYSIYPECDFSIGFSQRGCRLSCEFCVVPKKEGKNKNISSIEKLWKDNPLNKKKKILLLDNDFWGQKNWQEKANEIIQGKYKVCFSQGINIRLINKEQSILLSKINLQMMNMLIIIILFCLPNKKIIKKILKRNYLVFINMLLIVYILKKIKKIKL